MSTVPSASPPLSDLNNVGQKRTREEEPVTASGRAKQRKQDILATEARHVSRAMDAFAIPGAIFNYGLDNMASVPGSEPPEGATSDQIRWFNIYKYLCNKIPHFEQRIIDVDDKTFREHEKLFKGGISAARSDDIASLKTVVVDWMSSAPYFASTSAHSLARNSKATRGFNNPVIGKLMCPTHLNWEDTTVQQGLRDGTIEVLPSQWPNFCYPGAVPPQGDDDMWEGFLRHPLLVKTLKHIYTSPSSVDGIEGNRATRSSKAALAGMTGTTVGAIADAVMKLRHTLSTCQTFQKSDKRTNNLAFYYGLLDILEAPQSHERVQDLLRWYDKQLFPGHESTDKPAPNSALAKMRAQLGIAQ